MDSITQAALGAAIGQATIGKHTNGWKAIAVGALIATIPDMDVLLYAVYDSVEMLRIHRGLSHSILFALMGASALTAVFRKMKWFQAVSVARMWWFHFLCLFTHMLLDYCTAYGTQLLLPFSDARLGLDTVNVVDPVYTLPLLIATLGGMLIPSWKEHKFQWNAVGLALSTLYLALTLFIKADIDKRFNTDLQAANIEYTQRMSMPVGMASIKWYGVARTSDGIYMKPYSLWETDSASLAYFPVQDELLQRVDPDWAATMRWFSKGYYTVEAIGDTTRFYNLQVDMRGIVNNRTPPAPTKGYFEYAPNGSSSFHFGSGALK